MDIVLIYPVDDRWHWRRIDPDFQELFYSPVFFPSAEVARADATQHNTDDYRLEICRSDALGWA